MPSKTKQLSYRHNDRPKRAGEAGEAGGERVNAFPATRLQAPIFRHGKDRLICAEIAGNSVQDVNTQAPDFRYGVCSPCSSSPPATPALFLDKVPIPCR